jgi:hypothetical protein
MGFINCIACNKRFSEFAPECPFCKTANMPGEFRDHYNGPEFMPSGSVQKSSELVGFILHILPWVGVLLLMFLPPTYMKMTGWVVVVPSAVLMALEAGQRKGWGSAVLWFLGSMFFWIVFYPVYMFRRARYGVATNGFLCLLGALVYTGMLVRSAWIIVTSQAGM